MYPLVDFTVTQHIPNATDATNQIIFIAPFDCKLIQVRSRQRVTSVSGTVDVVKAATAIAISAGTSMLTAPISLSGTADTNLAATTVKTIGGKLIKRGNAIGLKFAGTLTNLVDLDITMVIRQTKKKY